MKFHLKSKIPHNPGFVNYKHRILTLGSCFSSEIGDKLKEGKFTIEVNPFGVLFNPNTILKCIESSVTDEITTEHIINLNQKYYHYDYHSDISADSSLLLEKEIKERSEKFKEFLKNGDLLIITLGTAWAYKLKATAKFIGNCHKMPAVNFEKELLSLDDQFRKWKMLLTNLKLNNSKLKVVFTVSPVRHSKDGLQENNVSKGMLHNLIFQLQNTFENVCYFPAYEVVMDELRDYRFYNSDLIHPTKQAVDYVFEKFSEAYFNLQTKEKYTLQIKIIRAENHIHLNATEKQIKEHKEYVKQLKIRFEEMSK